jgi:hypothetical protein
VERAAEPARATFFSLWAGARKRDRYRAELRRDLGEVLRYAEQGGIVGKVVLEP